MQGEGKILMNPLDAALALARVLGDLNTVNRTVGLPKRSESNRGAGTTGLKCPQGTTFE